MLRKQVQSLTVFALILHKLSVLTYLPLEVSHLAVLST